jgi:hypothetical protein
MNRTFRFGIYSSPAWDLVEQLARLATASTEFRELPQIPREDGIGLDAVLQALEVFLQFGCAPRGQRIDNPVLFAICGHHASASQVGEVFRNLHLRFAENILKMTDAERRFCEQVQNAKPRPVAKAFVNPN